MNHAIEKSLYQLTGSGNMEDVSISQLKQLADEHPYFAVSRFLLAKKMKANDDPNFLHQVQQTALYFHNPYWLHFQLLNEVPSITSTLPKVEDNISALTEEPTILPAADEAIKTTPTFSNEVEIEPSVSPTADEVIEAALTNTDEEDEPVLYRADETSETAYANTLEIEEPILPETEEVIDETATTADETPAFDLQHQITEEQFELADLAREEELATAAQTITEAVEIPQPANDTVEVEESPVVAEQNEETLPQDDNEASIEPISEFQPYQTQQEKTDEANDTEALATDVDEAPIHIPSLAEAAQILEKQIADVDLDKLISSEPYHTVDYFASQGIKPSLDENPQDKLGRQVKRFTEWIKHMKQIGSEEALEQMNDPALETTIQNIANTSNSSREIVTETMAEVLVKQGKTDKAIQLYIKLSFLNPDKSAFFASKIQQLKGITQ